MPELPEVETVRRDLAEYIVGHTISAVMVAPDFAKKIGPSVKEFSKAVVGAKVTKVFRRGKLLIFYLNRDQVILAHMKMTGQFVWWRPDNTIIPGGHPIEQSCEKPDRFNKVIITFGANGKLYYNDPRKFGFLKVVSPVEADKEIAKYGIEPIDRAFTFDAFNEILNRKPKLPLKQVLLMQDLVAGLGNIYVDESCFTAGVRCSRKVAKVTPAERKKLFTAIKKIIPKAIRYRGTSVNTYVDCMGKQGSYAQFLNVYHRVGQPCRTCKISTIIRTVVGGRGTAYCPTCQT